MKTLKVYRWDIPSKLDNVRATVENIVCSLKSSHELLDDNSSFELKVILNELFINAIKHGNKGDCSKHIKVNVGITDNEQVFIVVEDEGEGYNYNNFLDSCHSNNNIIDICDMKETGRGILIVKNLCDKVKFNNKGNKIVILKKLCKS